MAGIEGVTVGGIIVDIVLFFIIAGNAVIGYRKGLARLLFSIFSSIVAIILVLILYRPTTDFIINNTGAEEKLKNVFEEKLEYLFETETDKNLQDSNESIKILEMLIGDEIAELVEETTDSVAEYASTQIARKLISVFCFFALFAIIRLLLYVLGKYVIFVAELPVIRIVNGSVGMIYGILKGFLIIYIFFGIISFIMPIMENTVIMSAINEALIGSKMFNNNIVLNFIFKFLK